MFGRSQNRQQQPQGARGGAQLAVEQNNESNALAVFAQQFVDKPPEEPVEVKIKRARDRATQALDHFAYGTRRGAPEDEQREAALELAKWVEVAFGRNAAALGYVLRRSRRIALVLALLYTGDAMLHRPVLMILANIVSDDFDPESNETKKVIYNSGVFDRLRDFVFAGDDISRLYACAVIQNLVVDLRFARLFNSLELMEEFERLVQVSENPKLRRFCAGALCNMIGAIARDMDAQSLENRDATGRRGSVLSRAFSGKEDIPELSEAASDEIAKREAEAEQQQRDAEFAAELIQTVVRKRRARKAFKEIHRFVLASRIVVRWQRGWRRRRWLRAVLCIQAHTRASMCARRGICEHGTIILIIYGLREAHRRAVHRQVLQRLTVAKKYASKWEAHQQSVKAEAEPAPFRFQSHARRLQEKLHVRLGRLLQLPSTARAHAPARIGPNEGQQLLNVPRPQTISTRVPRFSSVVPRPSPRVAPNQLAQVTGARAKIAPMTQQQGNSQGLPARQAAQLTELQPFSPERTSVVPFSPGLRVQNISSPSSARAVASGDIAEDIAGMFNKLMHVPQQASAAVAASGSENELEARQGA